MKDKKLGTVNSASTQNKKCGVAIYITPQLNALEELKDSGRRFLILKM